jgi:hypothetical protein
VWIIAQSQFDVNEENVEGAVFIGSSTGNRMVFFRPMRSGLVSLGEGRCLDRDIMGPTAFVPWHSRATAMNKSEFSRQTRSWCRRSSSRLHFRDHQRDVA